MSLTKRSGSADRTWLPSARGWFRIAFRAALPDWMCRSVAETKLTPAPIGPAGLSRPVTPTPRHELLYRPVLSLDRLYRLAVLTSALETSFSVGEDAAPA
jgi:hypothetical protein